MPYKASINKLIINGNETLYIPLSFCNSNYNSEEFQALVIELVDVFKQYPDTPVYVQIFDTIHANTLVVERTDIFKYIPDDFIEEENNYTEIQKTEIKNAFINKIAAYHAHAIEIAKADSEKKKKDCEQSISLLKKHFTNVVVEYWEETIKRLKVKWMNKNDQRQVIVKDGFEEKIEEFQIKRKRDQIIAKQWDTALHEYYIWFNKSENVQKQISAKNTNRSISLNQVFVTSQVEKCLDQYIVAFT